MSVFQIEVERVRRRADFFLDEAGRLCGLPEFADLGFRLTDQAALFTAEAYYLVNSAYKDKRQNTGHRTQPTKIAAITATVVATVNPIRPEQEPETPSIASTYLNPLLALRLGCNIVQHPLHRQAWMRLQWFCDGLRNEELECLTPYIDAVRQGTRVIGTEFDISVNASDLRRIENRVSFFDVLSQMPIVQRAAGKSAASMPDDG